MMSSPPEMSSHTVLSLASVAALVDEGHLHGLADATSPASGCFLPAISEQRRLAGAVGADDADDGARRHLEAQVVDQQAIAKA
jgi:hypothetical protein